MAPQRIYIAGREGGTAPFILLFSADSPWDAIARSRDTCYTISEYICIFGGLAIMARGGFPGAGGMNMQQLMKQAQQIDVYKRQAPFRGAASISVPFVPAQGGRPQAGRVPFQGRPTQRRGEWGRNGPMFSYVTAPFGHRFHFSTAKASAPVILGDAQLQQVHGPVSYTHLDVYKRQPISATTGSASASSPPGVAPPRTSQTGCRPPGSKGSGILRRWM